MRTSRRAVRGGRKCEGLGAAYVIRGEKTELKARYHLSSGKWYSDALVVFHVGGFYNARYYSPLPLPPRAAIQPSPSRAFSPLRSPSVPPTLAEGVAAPSCSFYIAFSVHVRQQDWHSSTLPPSFPPSLLPPSRAPALPRVKPLPLIIVSVPPHAHYSDR